MGSHRHHLLDTKLAPPPTRPGVVDRTRLTRAVDPRASLVLYVAGPGYGKTTAAHQAVTALGIACAWVSLDPMDDSPSGFWSYVVEGLRRAVGAGDEAAAMIAEGAATAAVLTALLEDLARLDAPVALVLDDLHVIRSPEVLAGLTLLVDRLPDGVCVVATSRMDPALPVGRWRLTDRVAEIRQDALRFDHAEAAFLVDALDDVDLAPDDVATLVERTEGWPAGLGLSLLSLRGHDDGAEFVRTAFPPDRMVADYLLSEVLDRLPADDRRLLLDLSVVDDFDGALAVHLSGRADAGERVQELEAAGVLVMPVDEVRTRMRFHQLLRDLLVQELRWRDPERAAKLHWRAAEHLAVHGDTASAVQQYVAGGWLAEALALVSEAVMRAFDGGDLVSTRRWLALFPADFVAGDPARMVVFARLLATAGEVDAALGWLERATAADHPARDPWRAEIAALQTVIRAWQGDLELADEAGRAFLAEHGGEPFLPPVVDRMPATLARVALLRGELDEAERWLRSARTVGGGAVVGDLVPLAIGAEVALARGDVADAEGLARAVLDGAAAEGAEIIVPVGEAHGVLARVHLEQGDLAGAEASVRDATEVFAAIGITMLEVRQRLLGVRIATDRFGTRVGREVLAATADALRGRHVGASARALLDAADAELRLVEGDVAGALPLIDALPPGPETALLRARALVRTGRRDEADALLAGIEGGPVPLRLDVLLVRATCLRGDVAADLIEEAAALGVPRGYVRPFLAHGPELLRLVRSVHRVRHSPHLEVIVAAADRPAPDEAPVGGYATTLTEREQALLQLLPTHLTYREIAAQLCVSINTVKTYQKALYRKLQVATRADAVAAGRRAGLSGV